MIRPFQSDDAAACCDIVHGCILGDADLSSAVQQSLLIRETPALMRERAGLFYLAVHETAGTVTGFGGLDLNEIRLLFVSPRHRREGIGRAIIAHFETLVPPDFFRDMFVYAAPGAVGFYGRLGFEARGKSSFDIEGLPLVTVFMTKHLR